MRPLHLTADPSRLTEGHVQPTRRDAQLTRIFLAGLNRLDQRELAASLPNDAVELERPAPNQDEFGELITATLVLLLSAQALRVLSAWLLRTQRSGRIEQTIEVERPDGTRETRTLRVDVRESESPDADVLEALSKLLAVDPTALGPSGG